MVKNNFRENNEHTVTKSPPSSPQYLQECLKLWKDFLLVIPLFSSFFPFFPYWKIWGGPLHEFVPESLQIKKFSNIISIFNFFNKCNSIKRWTDSIDRNNACDFELLFLVSLLPLEAEQCVLVLVLVWDPDHLDEPGLLFRLQKHLK